MHCLPLSTPNPAQAGILLMRSGSAGRVFQPAGSHDFPVVGRTSRGWKARPASGFDTITTRPPQKRAWPRSRECPMVVLGWHTSYGLQPCHGQALSQPRRSTLSLPVNQNGGGGACAAPSLPPRLGRRPACLSRSSLPRKLVVLSSSVITTSQPRSSNGPTNTSRVSTLLVTNNTLFIIHRLSCYSLLLPGPWLRRHQHRPLRLLALALLFSRLSHTWYPPPGRTAAPAV